MHGEQHLRITPTSGTGGHTKRDKNTSQEYDVCDNEGKHDL